MASLGGSAFSNPLFTVVEFAAGTAMGPALRPVIQDLANFAWGEHPVRPFAVHDAALFIARSIPTSTDLHEQARWNGMDGTRFDELVQLFREYPGLAEALHLWRRREADPGNVKGWLNRHGYSDEVAAQLMLLKDERLDPAQLAVMIQRTVVPNPNILPNQPSTAGSNVPPMPQVDIDVVKEAEAAGIDLDRLSAMARIIGLPASPDLAARMMFRKIITEGAFNQAILEGNTRGEWAPFLLEGFRDIPTAHDFVEERLRGWTDDNGMYDGTARHGMSPADTDVLFKISGRPISFHQVFIGERRGGTYGVGNTGIDPAFLKALQESNIRPEWYNLAWAQRHSYPSAFVLRALATSGELTPDEVRRVLTDIGWPEWLIDKVVTVWTGGTTATTGPLTKSAITQAVTEIRAAYLIGQADETQARGWLTAIGVTIGEQDGMLPIWDVMKQVPQKGLTAAQIKKAFRDLPSKYPLTWATAELLKLGYTNEDVAALLEL